MLKPLVLPVLVVLVATILGASAGRQGGHRLLKQSSPGYGSTPPPSPPVEPWSDEPFLIGMAQYEEVYWDMEKSIEKACKFIETAGANGIKLISFSEGAISGYPWFNWWASTFEIAANERINEIWMKNSPQIGHDGGDLRPIMACAKKARVNVVLPINERDNKGSESAIFNTIVFIDLYGNIVGRHRKTTPSYTERMWWSFGDGSDLIVVDMPEVGKVCGLLCWENYMPLARYTLVAQGCEFWIAPTQDIGNHWLATAEFIARESRAYVLTTGQMFRPYEANKSEAAKVVVPGMSVSWAANMIASYEQIKMAGVGEYMMDGGSAIINPEGVPIAGPVYSSCNYCAKDNYTYSVEWAKAGCAFPFRGPESVGLQPCKFFEVSSLGTDREFLLAAYVSRGEVKRKKLYQDVVGNYARPDIWSVTWHNAPMDTMFSDIPMTTDGLKSYDVSTAQFAEEGNSKPMGPIEYVEHDL